MSESACAGCKFPVLSYTGVIKFMSHHKLMCRLAFSFLALALMSTAALAQPKDKNKGQSQDPTQRERNVKPELKKVYKDWLERTLPTSSPTTSAKPSRNCRPTKSARHSLKSSGAAATQTRTRTKTSTAKSITSA